MCTRSLCTLGITWLRSWYGSVVMDMGCFISLKELAIESQTDLALCMLHCITLSLLRLKLTLFVEELLQGTAFVRCVEVTGVEHGVNDCLSEWFDATVLPVLFVILDGDLLSDVVLVDLDLVLEWVLFGLGEQDGCLLGTEPSAT